MKQPNYKKIRIEDFSEEQQEFVEKLAFALNTTIENILDNLNSKISFADNIFSSLKSFNVEVDANNIPKNNIQVKINSKLPIEGTIVINTTNVTNPNSYPDASVQLFYTQKEDLLTIKKVVGLSANNVFTVKFITIN